MVVEYGIMSNKWSVEAEDKLVCYATILLNRCNDYFAVVLYNDECKDDQWAFADDIPQRLHEIFGEDFFTFVDRHEDDIRAAVKTIKKLV